ncbi:hypothetical protein A0H81_08487 [Grifola frondosa]|uniref:Uncharacterized protein n=1 Tax=Grifola frondosa TaxID=5627 RepID=A0A1C7M2Q6_GRIFR|nr:hypothetical protein A0H81_08487 [Grifola frondosa]
MNSFPHPPRFLRSSSICVGRSEYSYDSRTFPLVVMTHIPLRILAYHILLYLCYGPIMLSATLMNNFATDLGLIFPLAFTSHA